MLVRLLVLFILTVFSFQGCSSLLMKSTPAPVRYQLTYEPVTVECPQSFAKGVRIWELGTSEPYNQQNMVVVGKNQKVSYSSAYQWVSPPGSLIANSLLRDLSAGKLFSETVDGNSPAAPPLELTGHVFTFAWETTDGANRARLHAEMSLVQTIGKRKVILRQNYEVTSRSYQEDNADNFARAMSSTMEEFSHRLQEDLCRTASNPKSDSR